MRLVGNLLRSPLTAGLLVSTFVFGAQRPGAVFLLIWPGARATALSGAFSAIAEDATACYYNQAGLAFIDQTIVTLQHANWLPGLHPDMYYEFAGVVRPFKVGTFGLDIIYLTTGKTSVVNPEGTYLGEYTTFDIAVGLNYGVPLRPNLGLGVGWKFIYSYLVPDWVWDRMPELGIDQGGTGITYAFDVGVLYKPWSLLAVGAALQNIGPNISYTESGSSDPLPYTLRVGVRVEPMQSEIFRVALTADLTMFYKEEPYQLSKVNGGYRLKLKLPFITKKNVELNKFVDELIVRIGSFKRHIMLPRQVASHNPVKAKLKQQYLHIYFEGGNGDQEKAARG